MFEIGKRKQGDFQRHEVAARPGAAFAFGFALAPILYIIALAGIAGTVLFTGYTQILRSNVEITADNSVRNQIRMATEVVSSRSLMNSVALTLDPPTVVSWASLDAARIPKDSGGSTAITEAAAKGAAESAGGIPTDGGVRQLDPWGRYYIMCRWVNLQADRDQPSIAIVSAGPDGILGTDCDNATDNLPASGSDDKVEFMSVANVMARSATWQAQGGGTFGFGIDPSTARVAVGLDTASVDTSKSLDIGGDGRFRGDLVVNGDLTVQGDTAVAVASANSFSATSITAGSIGGTGGAALTISTDIAGSDAGLTGDLTVDGATTLDGLTAGATTLGATSVTTLAASGAATFATTVGVTGNTTVGGTLGVTGATTLGSVGVTGNAAVGGTLSAGATDVDSLSIDGNAVAAGTITAANFVGNLTGDVTGNVSGSAGSVDGSDITGVVPIASGGTGATSASAARTALGLAIGTDVQAYDADLGAVAALSSTGFVKRTGAAAFTAAPIMQSEVPAFSGATTGDDGTLGGVPIPAAGEENFLLRGDGTWVSADTVIGTGTGIEEGDSGVEVEDSATGAIIFTVDGFEQARIVAGASADRSLKINGGVSTTAPVEIAAYGASGNGHLRMSGLGTGNLIFRTNGSDRMTVDGTTGAVTASSFVGALTGNASTATALATARNFSITGDATASAVSFNGSADVALPSTVTKIRGVTVSATAPSSGEYLKYDGSAWTPSTITLSGDDIEGGTIGGTTGVVVLHVDGDEDNPSISFTADTDTGVYRSGTDEFSFTTGGTRRAWIDASGLVHIGANVSTSAGLTLSGSSGKGVLSIVRDDGAPNLSLKRVKTSLTSPTAVLSGDELGRITFHGEGQNASVTPTLIMSAAEEDFTTSTRASNMQFWTNPTGTSTAAERMRITGGGDVVIGSTSAASSYARLTVSGADKQIIAVDTGTPGTNSSGFMSYLSTLPTAADQRMGFLFAGANTGGTLRHPVSMEMYSDGAWTDGSSYPAYIRFSTTAAGSTARTERMRIDSAGNVGIGATPGGSTKLDVNGVIRSSAQLFMTDANGANGKTSALQSWDDYFYLSRWNAAGSAWEAHVFNVNLANGDTNIYGNLNVAGTITGTVSTDAITQGDSHATVTDTGTGNIVIDADGGADEVTITAGVATITGAMVASGNVQSGTTGNNGNLYLGGPNVSLRSAYASNVLGIYTNNVEQVRIDASGNVGIGATTPSARLHIVNSALGAQLRLSDNETNNTNKYGLLVASHYTNAEEPLAMIGTQSDSANSYVYVGGGFSTTNAATIIDFMTAANNATVTGTRAMRINSAGTVTIGGVASSGRYMQVDSNGTPTIRFDDNSLRLGLQLQNRAVTATNQGISLSFQLAAAAGAAVESGRIESRNTDTFVAGANQDADLTFLTAVNGSLFEGMRLASTGNVGIGTAAPGAKLETNAGDSSTAGTGQQIRMGNWGLRTSGGTSEKLNLDWSNSGWQTTPVLTADRVTGFLGIGTTSPSTKLHVTGNATITGNLTVTGTCTGCGAGLVADAWNDVGGLGRFYFASSAGRTYVKGNGVELRKSNDAPGFAMDNSGNLTMYGTTLTGAGSSATYGAFTVDGTKGGWGGINFKSSGTNMKTLMINTAISGVYNNTDNGWDWYFNGGVLTAGTVPASQITAGTLTGNYSITGTLNANGLIYGNSKEIFNTGDSYLRMNQSGAFTAGIWMGNSNWAGGSGIFALGSNGGTTTSRVYINGGTFNGANVISLDGATGIVIAAASMRSPIFYDQDNTGYYVDANGNTVLNTLSVGGAGFHGNFNVSGNGGSDGIVFRQNYDNSSSIQAYIDGQWAARTTYASGCCNALLLQPDVGVVAIRTTSPNMSYVLHVGGSVLAGGYFHSSDARLKHDIVGFDRDPFETIKGLRAVHFKWNQDNKQDFGVIAQETEKVLPEAVTRDSKGFLQVQYDKLVMPVIEAVKKLIGIVEELQAKVAELLDWKRAADARIAALEADNEKLQLDMDGQKRQFELRLRALEADLRASAVNDNEEPQSLRRAGGARSH